MVDGRWSLDVEKAVVEAIDSAFKDGLESIGKGHVRFRILRWIAQHEREEQTHAEIARDCGTTRETVSRTLSKLREAGMIWGTGKNAMYGLTPEGKEWASTIDHLDSYPARFTL